MEKVGYLIAYAGSKNIIWNDLLSDKEENSSFGTVKRGAQNIILKIKDDSSGAEGAHNRKRFIKKSD